MMKYIRNQAVWTFVLGYFVALVLGHLMSSPRGGSQSSDNKVVLMQRGLLSITVTEDQGSTIDVNGGTYSQVGMYSAELQIDEDEDITSIKFFSSRVIDDETQTLLVQDLNADGNPDIRRGSMGGTPRRSMLQILIGNDWIDAQSVSIDDRTADVGAQTFRFNTNAGEWQASHE